MENFDHYKPAIQVVEIEYPKDRYSEEVHGYLADVLAEFRLLQTQEEMTRYPTWRLTIKLLTDEIAVAAFLVVGLIAACLWIARGGMDDE